MTYRIAKCKVHKQTARIATEYAGKLYQVRLSCGDLAYALPIEAEQADEVHCTGSCKASTARKCRCSCGGEGHSSAYSDSVLLGLLQ